MAGPTAGVVFETPTLERLTWRGLMNDLADQWLDANFCWISDSTKFGGTYVGELRPFVGDVYAIHEDTWCELSTNEIASLSRATGLNLTHCVELGAMCKGPEDHRLLCEIARFLAQRHQGYVDFNDVISEQPCQGLLTVHWTDDGAEYSTQIGTPSACDWWMSQATFRMIK